MGRLFVVEGASDGIGKSTQFELLSKMLIADGNDVLNHHFPTYDEYYGVPAVKYLAGEFGKPEDLSPYFINGIYAMDRACAWYTKLKPWYDNDGIVLLDRYTTSSLIYQTALIDDLEEKKKFIDYVIDFEYGKLGIKEPDCVIFLCAPFDLITKMRMARKSNDGVVNDVHERDLAYLKKAYDNALFVAEYLKWDVIECSDGEKMRSIDDIHSDIRKLVKKKVR
jgi:dTMP kinase